MRTRLAREILAALPRQANPVPADQLALVLVLEGSGGLTVGALARRLGLGLATASELVTRAVKAGRVVRVEQGRRTIVDVTVKARRERERARVPPQMGGGV